MAPPANLYNLGDAFESSNYDSSTSALFVFDITFAASPQGIIVEAGGTGTGMFIGFNDSGEFIARAGDGSTTISTTAARVAIDPATYNFANKSGILTVNISLITNSVTVDFDEGGTGTIDYSQTATAPSGIPNWSGGDGGFFGNSNGNLAGREVASNFLFNGSFTNPAQFSNIGDVTLITIKHWSHRSGNDVTAAYGFVDLSALTSTASVTGQAKRWNGIIWNNVKVRSWTGSAWVEAKFWDGTDWVEQF
jgi:hypothetical protein